MSSKEQEFKERFAAVLKDLRENGMSDREAMGLVGSFSVRLVDLYKLRTWSEFKAALSREAYDRLIADFQEQGNAYHHDDKPKAAYAIQLLAMSVVAKTQSDPHVKQGEKLLDQMLDGMILAYRKGLAERAARAN